MNNTRLRFGFLIAIITTLLVTSLPANANSEGAAFLRELHQFRQSSFMALANYYRYSAVKNPASETTITELMASANGNLQAVTASGANALSSTEIEGLRAEFELFSKLMNQNVSDVTAIGYPDLRLVGEMADQAVKMNNVADSLYKKAKESSQTPVTAEVETARSASILMAQMLSRYAARSYSPVTQTFRGASGVAPLDEQARQLDALIDQFTASAGQGQLKETAREIRTKWGFIRESYINYNKKNVVFVIERYSRSILDELGNAVDALQSA